MPWSDDAARSFESSRFRAMIRERPLVAAGLGLAVGAAIAALFPATASENRMMGPASDDLKRRGREAAKEEAERLKAAAGRTYDAAREGAAHVADRAAEAAAEEGLPVGTLRAAHAGESEAARPATGGRD